MLNVPDRYKKVARFIMSGGTAAAVDLGLLHLLTDKLGLWYLLSAIIAFIIAFIVSFILQKFWTFQDHNTDGLSGQAAGYLMVGLFNLGLNTLLVHSFVEYANLHYLMAQILTSLIIAVSSFFIYGRFIFRNQQEERLINA